MYLVCTFNMIGYGILVNNAMKTTALPWYIDTGRYLDVYSMPVMIPGHGPH